MDEAFTVLFSISLAFHLDQEQDAHTVKGLQMDWKYIINTVLEAGIHTSQVSVGFAKYSFRLLYICNGPYISTDFR